MCKEEKKEGKKYPRQLPNTDTDFCGYVRAKDFSAYVEGRKEIILLNYLLWLQITITRLVVVLDSSLDISFFFVVNSWFGFESESHFVFAITSPVSILNFAYKGDNGMSGQ